MFTKIIALFTSVIAMVTSGIVGFSSEVGFDGYNLYVSNVEAIEAYENTLDTAIPQTAIYNLISDHFNSEGEKEKKAILIGYDGARADALMYGKETGAVKYMLSEGAFAYIGYCGGANFPQVNRQATSTAPGWCSILTGQWANVHGVNDNDVPKSNDTLTLLTTLVEDGKADSTCFYTSWGGHFGSDTSTYINEVQYCQENELPVNFVRRDNDIQVFSATVKELRKKNCADFLFTILEDTDHAGHDTGFSLFNEEYTKGFETQDNLARNLINMIEKRANYENEDWLIIIASDHGGFMTGHGLASVQERMTIILTNKEFTQQQITDGTPENSIISFIK